MKVVALALALAACADAIEMSLTHAGTSVPATSVPAHVKARVSNEDFTLRCPAGQAPSECQKSFPTVEAKDHDGLKLAVTERTWKMVQENDSWTTQEIPRAQIDYAKPGTYLLTFDAVDTASNPAEQLAFALMIDDKVAPKIYPCSDIVRSSPIEVGAEWSWCASEALDAIDGNRSITYDVKESNLGTSFSALDYSAVQDKVNRWTIGTWEITLKASDKAGNAATKTVTLTVEDNIGPEITVHGRSSIGDQQCGALYSDKGASASDSYDDHYKITTVVTETITGPAENPTPTKATISQHTGDYMITYNAEDSSPSTNAAVSKARPVTVVDTHDPVLDLGAFTTSQTHYVGGTFSTPSVSCTDTCDPNPTITEEWVKGFGIPDTYDPTLPAYVRFLPDEGCSKKCSTGQACGKSCISKDKTCQKAQQLDSMSKGDWSACDKAVFEKLMDENREKRVGAPSFFALDLSKYGTDKDQHGNKFVKKWTCTDYAGRSVSQEVTYTVNDNENPVLNLVPPQNQDVAAKLSGVYEDPGATCHDNNDGEITPTVTYGATGQPDLSKPDEYTVTYSCVDKAGNSAQGGGYTRTVKVSDNVCPVIKLKGDLIEVVEAGFPWVEPGWEVTDDVTPSEDMIVTAVDDHVDVYTAFNQFRSCQEIKNVDKAATNGKFVISVEIPDGSLKSTEVVCDFTSFSDAVTYFPITNDRIKPYGSDEGKCAEHGFTMPHHHLHGGVSAWAKSYFTDIAFPAEGESSDEYLCTLDVAWGDKDVHKVDAEAIKYAKEGVYEITYHTKDGAGNEECTPNGPITRKVVVKDTMPPVIVVTREGSTDYAASSMGKAQEDKLSTLPVDDPDRHGIPSSTDLQQSFGLRGSKQV